MTTVGRLTKYFAAWVDVTGAVCDQAQYSVGRSHEWHLVIASSFQEFTFGLMSWLRKHIGFSGISLSCTRFETIGSIGNAMHHNGFKQLLIQPVSVV